jgi:hypothetical protein
VKYDRFFGAGRSIQSSDITRVQGFPGFDKEEFEKLSGDDFEELDPTMANVTTGHRGDRTRQSYRIPAGWQDSPG